MNEAFQIVNQGYPELIRKPLPTSFDAQSWNDSDSSRLVDLLEGIDGLKHEIHERMRRLDAVQQARSLLREDALRTQSLNQKLEEIGKAVSQVRLNSPISDKRREEAEVLRMPSRESVELLQGDSFPGAASSDLDGDTAELLCMQARERVLRAEAERLQDLVSVSDEPSLEYKSQQSPIAKEDPSIPVLNSYPDQSRADGKGGEEIEARPDSISTRELSDMTIKFNEAAQVATEAAEAYQSASQKLVEAEQARKQAAEAIAEAKQLFDQSLVQLNEARIKEEKAAQDSHSTQQELTTAYQFASVAAQRQHDASEFFRKANLWAVNAAALSWVATVWVAWIAFRLHVRVWAPGAATAAVMLLAIFMARWGTREE